MEQNNPKEWNNMRSQEDEELLGATPHDELHEYDGEPKIEAMKDYFETTKEVDNQPNFIMINKEQAAQESQVVHESEPTSTYYESTIRSFQANGDTSQNTYEPKEDYFHTHTDQAQEHSYSSEANNGTIPHNKPKSKKGLRTPLVVAGCLLLGGVGGFGGAYLANSFLGTNGQTVIYQSVERKDSDGNTVTNMSVKDVVANTEQSVVEITTESAATDSYFSQMVTTGAGSGVIISKDGYIVTNNHVVEGANKITVRTKDGTEYSATLIGTDQKTDLAVIKVDAAGLTPAVFGTSGSLSVGDEAIAIGNPLGELGGTVTQGIISALDREISIDGQTMTLLQTDTAINKGNSGGGLFNNNGELIGIVNAKSSGTSVEGLGFAIPIDTAKPVIESLISNGYVTGRPQLGVTMVNVTDEMTAFQAGVNELGVYIAKVSSGSAAEEAGFEVKDRVISVDGQEISSSSDISKIIDSKQVGDTISIIVERDGKEVTLKATLKEAQNTSQASGNENSTQNQNGKSGGNGRNE